MEDIWCVSGLGCVVEKRNVVFESLYQIVHNGHQFFYLFFLFLITFLCCNRFGVTNETRACFKFDLTLYDYNRFIYLYVLCT